jgi:hypothetical protein
MGTFTKQSSGVQCVSSSGCKRTKSFACEILWCGNAGCRVSTLATAAERLETNLLRSKSAGLGNGKPFAFGSRFGIRRYVRLGFGLGHAGLPRMGDCLRFAHCRFSRRIDVGWRRAKFTLHTSHAKLACEDALNAGVSTRAAAFMPAPDHSPAPASTKRGSPHSRRRGADFATGAASFARQRGFLQQCRNRESSTGGLPWLRRPPCGSRGITLVETVF